ncbi:hypothetical protein BDB01DRAFT_853441 [Pilobolus umbonatus]|nr:hypothetical protein BDB01DRAFT_853441 [Pilobolus umbonatus]
MFTNFSTAIHHWKSVQLSQLQKELDQQGLSIVENQKDGLVSRKKLAEQTREFKKMPDENKLQQFKSLLKAYQSEIDHITKRTKYAESAFLSVYKTLADAPDPTPLFEVAVEQSTQGINNEVVELENKELKEKLNQVNTLLQASEQTNKELSAKVTTVEASLEEIKSKETHDLRQEMKDQYSNKIRQHKEREHDLQRRLNEALDRLNKLRQSHDDTQAELINHNQKYDEEVIGKLAELDMVTMDLERANGKIIQLEKQYADLKEKYSQLEQSKDTQDGRNKSNEYEGEINKLMKDVESYKDMFQKTETRLSKKIRELSANIESLTEERDQLKKKMKQFEDYDEIKRELHIMKVK